jgi:hypothetical protein
MRKLFLFTILNLCLILQGFSQDITLTGTVNSSGCGYDITPSGNVFNTCLVTGYSWAPATGLSCTNCCCPTATPSVTTTYTCTFSSDYCGSTVATITLTPSAILSAGTITGETDVPSGASTTLSSTVPGGTWSCSPSSVATIDPTTGVFTGISGGGATITYTVATACGTATATYYIKVKEATGVISGPSSVCPGSSISLSASGTASGTWSGTPSSVATINATTGVVTGISAGTATVTYTTGSIFTTYTVTVNLLVSGVIATATPGRLCFGSTITLSGSATGATSFSWNGPGGYSASVLNPAAFTSSMASSGIYTLIASNSCGSASDTATVTVDSLPVAGIITGERLLCQQAATTFTSSGTPGGIWSSSNTSVATVISTPTSGILTGTYNYSTTVRTVSIIYTVTNTCGTASASKLVKIKGIPVIVGGSSPCAGYTITLSCSPTPGGTITTRNNPTYCTNSVSGNIVTVNAIAASPTRCDTITYYFPGDTNVCEGTAIKYINVVPVPLVNLTGPSTVHVGSSITISADASVTSWGSSNTLTATVSPITGYSATVYGVSVGTVTISATKITGCTATATKTITVICPTCKPGRTDAGIETQDELQGTRIYPNPTTGQLSIELPGDTKDAGIAIYDLMGKEVIHLTGQKQHISVDLQQLPAGSYIVKIVSGSATRIEKVILE